MVQAPGGDAGPGRHGEPHGGGQVLDEVGERCGVQHGHDAGPVHAPVQGEPACPGRQGDGATLHVEAERGEIQVRGATGGERPVPGHGGGQGDVEQLVAAEGAGVLLGPGANVKGHGIPVRPLPPPGLARQVRPSRVAPPPPSCRDEPTPPPGPAGPGDGGAVGEGGLEPPHPFGHRNLNPPRLPIPPLARVTWQG